MSPDSSLETVFLSLFSQWANLRAKKNQEKKLAVTIFSFPPDKGNVGTAAYLDVFGSIHTVLTKLRKEVRGGRMEMMCDGRRLKRREAFCLLCPPREECSPCRE